MLESYAIYALLPKNDVACEACNVTKGNFGNLEKLFHLFQNIETSEF